MFEQLKFIYSKYLSTQQRRQTWINILNVSPYFLHNKLCFYKIGNTNYSYSLNFKFLIFSGANSQRLYPDPQKFKVISQIYISIILPFSSIQWVFFLSFPSTFSQMRYQKLCLSDSIVIF